LCVVATVGLTRGVGAKAPPPPVVSTDSLVSDLVLPPKIVARARVNHELFLRARDSEAALCAFVADSVSLAEPFREAFFAAKSPLQTSGDDAALVLGAQTDGVFAGWTTEYGFGGILWDKLLTAAPPTDRPVLEAAHQLDGPNNWGVWTDPVGDWGGCHKPELASVALARLVRPWSEAPVCLRAALKPYLVTRLKEMAEDVCFCAAASERATVSRRLEANARVLEGLRDLGPPIARKLRAAAKDPAARFSCGPR
jgi:hypothetical protein